MGRKHHTPDEIAAAFRQAEADPPIASASSSTPAKTICSDDRRRERLRRPSPQLPLPNTLGGVTYAYIDSASSRTGVKQRARVMRARCSFFELLCDEHDTDECEHDPDPLRRSETFAQDNSGKRDGARGIERGEHRDDR